MNPLRISFGEKVAAGSGAALLVVMSAFNWFTPANDPTGAGNSNAWEAFSVIDLVLFLVVLAAVGMPVARAARVDLRSLPAPPGLLVGVAGSLACALILYRLFVLPDLSVEYQGVKESGEALGGTNRSIGVFLGLIASAGIGFGGWAETSAWAARGARRWRR